MLAHLALACGMAFAAKIVLRGIRTRGRLAEYARAKQALRNAHLWLTLDYTLEDGPAKEAKRFLKCALFQVECEELNFRVMSGGMLDKDAASLLTNNRLQG